MELKGGTRLTALALSILYTGLGHAYVRSWHRALVWYLGGLTAFLVVSPETLAGVFAAQSIDAVVLASRSLPVETLVVILLGVRVLGTVDVWWLLRRRVQNGGPIHCDSCARTLDADIEFCPWCLDETGGR